MTIVKISDASLLLSLRAHLAAQADCVVTAVTAHTLDVTVLGSYGEDAMDMETELRVRAWEEAQRANGLEVLVELD